MREKLFKWMWKKRLVDQQGHALKIIEIKGWRTVRVDTRTGSRFTTTFLFKLFKWYI